MAGNSDDRTEQPTAKRLRDARKKGQVVRSRDLVQAASLFAVVMAAGWLGGDLIVGLANHGRYCLAGMSRFPAHDLQVPDVTALALTSIARFAAVVLPLALAAAVTTVAVSAAQGGWVVATEALTLDFNKLNPATGMKRLGFSMAGPDLIKAIVAVALLGFIGYRVVVDTLVDAERLARMAPLHSFAAGWAGLQGLLRQSALALLALAGADYLLQRHRLMKSLKMTKQEVKDELKAQEGNPQVKARIRGLQFQAARKRMLAAVPKATVVVTNPTHFAVALEYHRTVMPAPRVVAKGRGFVAERIKAIARDHGVPMVENVPLAQALYKTAEVGDTIPAALFEAVAEVLAYLVRLRQLVL